MSADALDLLERGDIEVLGLLPYSSNYTFLARVTLELEQVHAVYKPRRGEQPLWDFEHGSLAGREVAAFLVAEAAGWGLVPPTIMRSDGPLGEGSLQLFIEHDPDRHLLMFLEERPDDLLVFAAFDAVINNADRKAGHVLEDKAGNLWAVDHGVTFHVEPKLRTVIWAFADQSLGPQVREGLERLVGPERDLLTRELQALLEPEEIAVMFVRAEALLEADRFPKPTTARPLPWPLI